jgi:hypothetical protein
VEKESVLDNKGMPKVALVGMDAIGIAMARAIVLTNYPVVNYPSPQNVPQGFLKTPKERRIKSRPEPVSESDRQFSLRQHKKQKAYKNRRKK